MDGSDFPANAPNSLDLPYAVRPRSWLLYAQVALWTAVGLAPFGFIGLLGFEVWSNPRDATGTVANLGIAAGLSCLFTGLASFQLWRLYRPGIVLYPDRIEVRGLFGRRSLRRVDIDHVGKMVAARSPYFELFPRPQSEKPLPLPAFARTDPVLAVWLEGLRDPEGEALAAERAALIATGHFGFDGRELAAKLDRAKGLAYGFTALVLGAAIWILISGRPTPCTLAVTAAAPALAWALVSPSEGLIRWISGSRLVAQVGIAALAPSAAMAFRVMTDDRFDGRMLLAGEALAAGVVAGLAVYLGRGGGRAVLAETLLTGAGLALALAGLAGGADQAFDRAAPTPFAAEVLDRHAIQGKSVTYQLTLTGWSGRAQRVVTVDRGFYNDARIGSLVCGNAHPGALGPSWYEIWPCVGVRPLTSSAAANRAASYYPPAAARAEIEGSATVACAVSDALLLEDCQVLEETPPGYGFGAAAIALLQDPALGPGAKVRPTNGARSFRETVRFKRP